ncbi:unnamed protein product [Symbiodinium natans]|uniref:Uncharacterized protein n=1 Tax=Symbiodinium natans TaxID=878477 RepID=A0A812QW62_9DINO|nr:unnamed protein product [Symbiodinium natans]
MTSGVRRCCHKLLQHFGRRFSSRDVDAGTGAALRSLGAARRWADALALLASTLPKSGAPDAVLFGHAMSAMSGAKQWQRTLVLLEEMRNMQIHLNETIFSIALVACDRGSRWRQALQLLEEFDKGARHADSTAYCSSASACAKASQWPLAVALFAQVHVLPDLASHNAAMAAAGRGQLWQGVLQLLKVMPSKVQPNLISFNTAMAACERAGQWNYVVALLEELGRKKLSPDIRSWTSLVASFSRASHWMQAQRMLRDLRIQELQPDLVMYGAAASAFQRGHQWKLALALLPQLHELRIVLDERLCGSVITACAISQAWQAAVSCLMELPRRELEPTSTSSSPVLTALLDVKHWLMALKLFEHLQHAVAMDSQAYGRLLLVCEQNNFREWQNWLLQSMASPRGPARHTPGRESLAAAVAAHCKGLSVGSFGKQLVLTASKSASRTSKRTLSRIPWTQWTPYVKEIRLMEHVFLNAECGNPASVCQEVECFGRDILGRSKTWLKVAGGEKSEVLLAAAQHAEGRFVLEVGTYCGHSSLRLAAANPNTHVVTLEADPVHDRGHCQIDHCICRAFVSGGCLDRTQLRIDPMPTKVRMVRRRQPGRLRPGLHGPARLSLRGRPCHSGAPCVASAWGNRRC